jgi:glutamine synthetase
LIDGYIDLRTEEVQALEHTPHPVEFAMYYSA